MSTSARRHPRALSLALLAFLLLAFALLWGSSGQAQASSSQAALAPSNPAFLEALADPSSIATRTADGHALGLLPCPVDPSFTRGLQVPETIVVGTPPATYDLRTLGRVTSVKDQGNYGTCWAFASVGSVESALLGAGAGTWNFSEDNMVLQSGFGEFTGYSTPELNLYQHGGNLFMGTAYLARWGGPVNEGDDAYGDSYTPSPLTVQKHVQEVNWIPARGSATDNTNVKNAVMTYGAVYTAMYIDEGSAYYKPTTRSYYYNGGSGSNHAVLIVGWNDSYSASNFATRPIGNGAFIVKNSWGTGWGDSGYFYVSYYDTKFGRDSYMAAFSGVEPTTNYTGVYQYDPLGNVRDYYTGSSTGWFANAFDATASSSIAAVGFYTVTPATTYEVYTGTSLYSKTLRTSGSFAYMGYHTVPLPSPVSVTAGNRFYVFVKVVSPGTVYPIAIEYPYSGYSDYAGASSGQSYISTNGADWKDLTTIYANTNVCLKAYTGGSSAPQVTLATSVASGSGSITKSPSASTYDQGSSVVLTAVPSAGYAFSGWGGDASGSTNPLTVVMDTDKNITASFTALPAATRFEQDNTLLAYTGTWKNVTGTSYSGGSYKTANVTGSSVTATFTGSAITYIAKTGTAQGKAKVTLDGGTPDYVDLYSSVAKYKQTVWSRTGLDADSSHTLVIEWTGQKTGTGTTINLDALDIVGTLTSAPAAQYTLATAANPVSAGTVTRSLDQATYEAGTVVVLTATPIDGYVFSGWTGDAAGSTNPLTVTMNSNKSITALFSVESAGGDPTRYEQNNSLLAYSGTWSSVTGTSYSGGSYKTANAFGASVTVAFTGTSIAYIARTASNLGQARLTLDDGPSVLVDLYSPTVKYKQTVWSAAGLSDSSHTLLIEWSGLKGSGTNTTINLDALDIVGTLTQATAAPKSTRYEQTSGLLAYAGTWRTVTGTSYSGGSYKYANTSGASVTATFTGTAIGYVAKTASSLGLAKVTLDGGTPVYVDLYSSTTKYKRLVWCATGLSAGTHTLVIEWTGQKGKGTGTTINLDALDIIGTLVSGG